MTTSPAHLKHVGIWLNDLGALVAGSMPLAETKTRIAAVTSLLAEHFPRAETFTRASLAAMAREFRFFPSYAEVFEHLNRWWDINRPQPIPLPGMNEDMPEADRIMVLFWNEYRSGDKEFANGNTPEKFEHWLSMIRRPTPVAFNYLCLTDPNAAEIARRNRWISEPDAAAAV
jgi:hypothetical protein